MQRRGLRWPIWAAAALKRVALWLCRVQTAVYIRVCASVCSPVCLCDWKPRQHTCSAWTGSVSGPHIPFRRAPVWNRSIWSKKKKEFFLPLCHCFTEGPYSLGAPRKAVPYSSYPQHFAPACLGRFIRDGFGAVHHLTYEYRDALGGRVSWMNHLHSAKITVWLEFIIISNTAVF